MANRFWVGGTGTWNATNTANWAATTGGAGGQSVPVAADVVTFDASSGGGVVTVNTNFNITSLTIGAFTGTLDFSANNNSPTMGSFSGTGTGTRTLNMGSGTWTISGAGGPWSISTSTNMTLNAQQSRILLTNTGGLNITFTGGNLTYYIVEYSRVGGGNLTISGSNTFANFIDNTINTAHTILFPSGATNNFYRFNVRGSAGALITLGRSSTVGAQLVKLGQGTVCNCDYITLSTNQVQVNPANTWYRGANGTGTSTGWGNSPTSSQSLGGIGGVG